MFPPERIVCLTEETVETLYLLGEERRIGRGILAIVLLIVLVQLFQTIGTAIATHSDKRLRK